MNQNLEKVQENAAADGEPTSPGNMVDIMLLKFIEHH